MNERDEQQIRSPTAAIPLEWVEQTRGRLDGAQRGEFVDLIDAAHLVADEGRLSLQRWIDAGRRAGLSWTDVGTLLGISKQAAQQRFGTAAAEAPEAADGDIVAGGATAINEVRLLEEEGRKGRELVAVAPFKLVFRQTGHAWEYRRLAALAPTRQMARLQTQGWSHVASWFPFHYFKRRTERPARDA